MARVATEDRGEKLNEIQSHLDGGMTLKEATAKAKISVPTYYNWKKAGAGSRGTRATGRVKAVAGKPGRRAGGDVIELPSFPQGMGIAILGSPDFIKQVIGSLRR